MVQDTEKPVVSVVMSALNAESSIAMTLKSLIAQTEQNWELLLVDDGSSDRTSDVVNSFNDQRIRLHRGMKTRGAGSRANQMIDVARAQYIARMDADDICFPTRFEHQIKYLQKHPDVDLLATEALIIDDEFNAIGMYPQTGTTHEEIIARRHVGFHFPQPTWMGRTEWFRKHRYDVSKIRSQDLDLLLRSFRTSRFALLPEVLLAYRRGNIPLWKLLRGRRHLATSMVRNLTAAGEPLNALKALSLQVVKGAVDVVAEGLGASEVINKRRIADIPKDVRLEWERCLRQIRAVPGA